MLSFFILSNIGCDIVVADMVFLVEASDRIRSPIDYWSTLIEFLKSIVDK